jgi:hypothetical protein
MENLQWPEPVVGSVADWKAANPDATECNLSYRSDITADDIKLLAGIQKLSIRGCAQLGNDAIQHLTGIKILDMVQVQKVTDAAFPSLAGVKSLQFTGCPLVTDEAITHLAGVEVLVMRVCTQITGSTFGVIKGVRELDCSGCYRVKDAAIQAVKGVKYLSVSECKKLTNEAFSGHEALESLSMASCVQLTITDEAFEGLDNLRSLDITGCYQETLSDEAFEGLDKLRSLSIDDCPQFTDEALKPINQLNYLGISGCDMAMCGPNLKRLKDAGTIVEDDGLCDPPRVLPPGRNVLGGPEEVQSIRVVNMTSYSDEAYDEIPKFPVPDVISDTVYGDVDLQKFMILNTGTGIILKIDDKFVGISRKYLSNQMESGESTYYECVEEFTRSFEFRDIYDTPYFAIKTPLGSLYTTYAMALGMIDNTHSFWELEETPTVLAFTASRSGVMAGGPIVSADHCQAGTSKKVYTVYPIMFEVDEEKEDVPTTLGLKFGETRVEVDYSPTQTLGELRATIETKFDLAPDKQRLLYNGRELSDDAKTLKELNVQAGFTVAVMKRGGRRTFRNVRKSRKRKPSN